MGSHWSAEHIFHLLQFQLTLESSAAPIQVWLKDESVVLQLKRALESASVASSREEGAEEVRLWLVAQVEAVGSVALLELIWSLLYPILMEDISELPSKSELAALQNANLNPLQPEDGLLTEQAVPFSFMAKPPQNIPPLSAWSGGNSLMPGGKSDGKDKAFQWDVAETQFNAWEGVLGAPQNDHKESILPPTLSQLETGVSSLSLLEAPASSALLDSPSIPSEPSSLSESLPGSLSSSEEPSPRKTPVPLNISAPLDSFISPNDLPSIEKKTPSAPGLNPIDLLSTDFVSLGPRMGDSPLSTMTELPQASPALLLEELVPDPLLSSAENYLDTPHHSTEQHESSLTQSHFLGQPKDEPSLSLAPLPNSSFESVEAQVQATQPISEPLFQPSEFASAELEVVPVDFENLTPPITDELDPQTTSARQDTLDAAFDVAFESGAEVPPTPVALAAPSFPSPEDSLMLFPFNANDNEAELLDSEQGSSSHPVTPSSADLDVVVGAAMSPPSGSGISAPAPLMLNRYGVDGTVRGPENFSEGKSSVYIKGQRGHKVSSDRVPSPKMEAELRYFPIRLEQTNTPITLSEELEKAFAFESKSKSTQFLQSAMILLGILVLLGGSVYAYFHIL